MKYLQHHITAVLRRKLMQPQAVAALMLTLAAIIRLLQAIWLQPMLTIASDGLAVGGAAIVACQAIRSGSERITVSFWLTAYLLACTLSIIVNRPHPAFMSWPQLILFAAMIAAIGPLLTCDSLRRIRIICYKSMIRGGYCIVLASAVAYITEYLQSGCTSAAVNNYDGLTGVAVNGMTLSPIAALSSIDAFWQMLHRKGRTARLLYGMMFIVAILVCIRSGSRIALAGWCLAMITITVMEWRLLRCHWRPILAIFTISAFAIALMPGYFSYAIIYKFQVAIEHGTLIFSRSAMWPDRLAEFQSSPVVGVGFHAFTQTTSMFSPEGWTPAMGALEPGSSWLTVLSQTGLAGAMTLGVWLVTWFVRLCRRREAYWLAITLFLLANGISEGWLTYSGAIMFMAFWLIAGITWRTSTI